MSDSVLCDYVWQDNKDGYNYWECSDCGALDSEKIEEYDLDDE